MVRQHAGFGEDLRRRRLAAGLTLTCLARQVHYSKSQMSKVERGLKTPSRELARLCDAALDARGALAALAESKPSDTAGAAAYDITGAWLTESPTADHGRFRPPMTRRKAMALGAASIPGMRIGIPLAFGTADNMTLPRIFQSLLKQYRQLGQVTDPTLLLPVMIAQVHALRDASSEAGPRTRRPLLVLSSRYAEYVGWLAQETGNEQEALWWTQRATELATAGHDDHLASYALVRRALITLYHEDSRQTIELARLAQDSRTPPRIRGLAIQREAQGHALAGDYNACMRSLEHARRLLVDKPGDSDAPILGTTNLADSAEMIRGWCLYDLGRPRAAAETIGRQLSTVPQQAVRTRVRYGTRQALSYAAAGEVDHACRLAAGLLDDAIALDSATIATDLRKLARTLNRYPGNASVRSLTPRLGTALRMASR